MIFHQVGELQLMFKKWFMEIVEKIPEQVLHLQETQQLEKKHYSENI